MTAPIGAMESSTIRSEPPESGEVSSPIRQHSWPRDRSKALSEIKGGRPRSRRSSQILDRVWRRPLIS